MTEPSCVILGTPGFIRDSGRFDDAGLLQVLGANAGNLMFQLAASRLIDMPLSHVSRSETAYGDVSVLRGAKALVFPAANHLRTGADWTGLCNYLERCKLPLVVLGLGAQSPAIGGESGTIAALKADPHVQRLAGVLRERAVFISVRGAFSLKVCQELGLQNLQLLGCPSALLNPDPALGQAMAQRIAALQAGQPQAPRLALAAAAPFEIAAEPAKRDLERRLLAFVRNAGPEGLYIQQSGGITAMQVSDGRWYLPEAGARRSVHEILAPQEDPVEFWAFMARSALFPISAPDWIGRLSKMDLALGTRIHGCMAAIAGGTPGVLVAHDSRTDELRETMHLPCLSMEDVTGARDLPELLARIRFDAAAFDRWRQETARALFTAFAGLGIQGSPHLRALAGL